MKTIGVVANCRKPHVRALLQRLADKARAMGVTLLSCDEAAELEPRIARATPEEMGKQIDVLVAMGGDGTLLRAVRALGYCDTPVLGVNIGSLGFLTSIPEEQLEHALDVLSRGAYETSDRPLAACRAYRGEGLLGEYHALNDIVVGWGESPRIVTLAVSINGTDVTAYVCDGLIISTPTGSTGHSLSANGPIVHPETCAFVLNPICPHTLSNRPIVVPDRYEIAVRVEEATKKLLFAVDGQDHHALEQGDRIVVQRSPRVARMILLPESNYFALLRQKLHWRGSAL